VAENLNVPPPPAAPGRSGWKKDAPENVEEQEETGQSKEKETDPRPQRKSGSSGSARTRARTNGQKDSHQGSSKAADIIEMLDSVRARHGHPQLERASVSHRWPQWAIDTVSRKAQVEKRSAADILAEALKRGFAGDAYAEHYYAEACERVNARENDWSLSEEDDD
jgi:hypothetical protein